MLDGSVTAKKEADQPQQFGAGQHGGVPQGFARACHIIANFLRGRTGIAADSPSCGTGRPFLRASHSIGEMRSSSGVRCFLPRLKGHRREVTDPCWPGRSK
jgi:hypothetical protein